MSIWRKFICGFMAMMMIISLLPMSALAAEGPEEAGPVEVQTCADDSHVWDEGVGSETVVTYTCTVCGATKDEPVETPPAEVLPCADESHIWDEGVGSETVITYTCTVCGATKDEAVEAPPAEEAQPCADDAHVWDDGIESEAGMTFTCTVCGATRVEEVAAFAADGSNTFSNFAELKMLADQTYAEWTHLDYTGTGPLVIEENLTLPENVHLGLDELQVPAGVTLDAPSTNMDFQTLLVNGTMTANNVHVHGSVTINGTYKGYGNLYIGLNAPASGLENFMPKSSWSRVIRESYVTSFAEIQTVIAAANRDSASGITYEVNFLEDPSSELVIDRTMTVPENCEVITWVKTTITAGTTVEVNGKFTVFGEMVLQGAMVNESEVFVGCSNGGTITLDGGSYEGDGILFVSDVRPENALLGFDLTNFNIGKDGDMWVLTLSNTPGTGSSNFFSNFAELKALMEKTYPAWTNVEYTGVGPLVIEEDLTIPENVHIRLAEMQIPAGVTLDAENGNLEMDILTVDGTLNANIVHVFDSLTINGTYNAYGWLYLLVGANAAGLDKVQLITDWSAICWFKDVKTLDDIKAVMAAANADSTPNVRYQAGFWENAAPSLLIDESITIPANCEIIGWNQITIAAGCTVEVNGSFAVPGQLAVQGKLINRNEVYVNGFEGGKVTLENGGTYEGTGRIFISDAKPEDVLFGFDLDDFDINSSGDGFWNLKYVGNLQRLGTPTDLEWGLSHSWTENDGEKEWITEVKPGFTSWKPHEPYQGEFQIQIFREGETEPCGENWIRFGSTEMPEWANEYFAFYANESLGSGTYYFTVTAIGDGINYRNSEPATSENWTYVQPAEKLGACTNPTWNWPQATWTWPNGGTDVGGHSVQFFYAPKAGMEPRQVGASSTTWEGAISTQIYDDILQENGDGYYYFRVRAFSSDITKVCNGEWSAMSAPYNLTSVSEEVKNDLDNILTGGGTDADKVDAIQNMDTENLKDAMLANKDVVDKVSELENTAAGGAANVNVDSAVAGFSGASVVGANLNVRNDDTQGVTLEVAKPQVDHVVDGQYDNSVAVKFSMNLNNVTNPENLEVPVQVTLPIPSTINPAFLVILHYHVDGSYEEIWPHIYTEDNVNWFAQFVLTSFSDFTMTQKIETAECTHEWGDWTATKAPTCTEKGEETRTCGKCGETETREIPALGHTEVIDEAKAATCTETGLTEGKHCSVCGEVIVEQTVIDALGHDYGEWTETKAPTCIEKGEETRECSRCDATENREKEAKGHAEVIDAAVPATCTETGLTEGKHCSVCGEVIVEQTVIDALGHDYGEWTETKAPTCTEKGEETSTCSRCEATETHEIDALGHDPELRNAKEPTDTEDGYTGDEVCKRCEEVLKQGEVIPAGKVVILDANELGNPGVIWVDGVPYSGDKLVEKDGKYFITMPDDARKVLTTYTYQNGGDSDRHKIYPTGMRAWVLTHDGTSYTAAAVPELNNILQYCGSSIRMTGVKGIRMITGVPESKRYALIHADLAGYTLEEYGTVVGFADQVGGALTLDNGKSNYAYKRGVSDAIFAWSGSNIQYTNVLVGFTMDQCKEDIAMRPYMKLSDADGNEFTLYGGTVYRSIGYIAWQNRDIYPNGSDGYNYIWDIINAVYGDNLPG